MSVLVEIQYDRILHETEDSLLLDFGGEKKRIPKSVTHNHDKDEKTIDVEEWLAINEGLV